MRRRAILKIHGKSTFSMDLKALVDAHFPTLKEVTNLDNASMGTPPVECKVAIIDYFDRRMAGGLKMIDLVSVVSSVKQKLSKLLGGDEKNYALVPNTTEGINGLAHAWNVEPGSNIVICDLEFPANYVPWQNLVNCSQREPSQDIELRIARSTEGMISLEQFEKLIDESTTIVSISHVQFSTGFKADVRRLVDMAHDVGALVCLDVIQSAGVLNFDFPSLGIDFAAGNATKWLLGPVGAGFIYVSDEIDIRLFHPRYAGWWGVDNVEDFSYREFSFANDASRFQVGSPAFVCYHGLDASLDVLLSIPSQERERVSMVNANHLRKRLDEAGISYLDFPSENLSPIVSCKPSNVEAIHARLLADRILCSVRDGRLRVSPYFYNSTAEIDRLVDLMLA